MCAKSHKPKKHPALAWLQRAGLAAILLGGMSMMALYYWPSVVLCYLGFVLLGIDVFFEPDLKKFWRIALLSFIAFLCAAFSFGFVCVSAPLNLSTQSYNADYQAGQKIGGIEWSHKYTELHVFMGNPTEYDYGDLNVVLRPDQPIVAIGEIGDFHRASFEDALRMTTHMEEVFLKTSKRNAFQLVLVASNGGYRVRCEKLPAHSNLEVVMAIATVFVDPQAPPFNQDGTVNRKGILKVDTSDGTSRWFADAINDARYGPRPSVKEVQVEGEYRAILRKRKISQKLPVRDELEELLHH